MMVIFPQTSNQLTLILLLDLNYVCLTVNDSISSCSSTFCDSIIILPPGNCNGNFTYVDNGNGNFLFTNTSTGNYTYWYWDFGAGWGNQSHIDPTPSFSFPTNGSYNVCLYVSDSATGCFSTFCNIINVNCFSSFYGYLDSIGPFDVVVVNNSTGNNLTYLWGFGDGNTSTQQFPQHNYITQGNYYLCLTVDDGNGCIDMYCDSINASGINKQNTGFTINIISPTATSISEEITVLVSQINIYPNPTQNQINIETKNSAEIINQVKLFDIKGQLIYNEKFKPKINTSQLSKGLYFLKLETDEGEVLNYKLIKE
jgi:hypothetical protein